MTRDEWAKKMLDWLEWQAKRSRTQARNTPYITIQEACVADAKNYEAMAREGRKALENQ